MSAPQEQTLFALLFALGEPTGADRLAAAMELDTETVRLLLVRLRDALDEEGSALQLLRLEDQYQLATREQYTPVIRRALTERRNTPLSPAALEVLAVVAYNQPVTRAYVEQVRGVDSSGTVATLVEKGLLEEAGRLDLPGRPIAYRTTAHFLRTFGLESLSDLPSSQEDPAALPPDLLEGQLTFATPSAAPKPPDDTPPDDTDTPTDVPPDDAPPDDAPPDDTDAPPE